ncbi:hypothetical protein ILUMI_26395 [Ignelater luminosus]|uniref:Uncharacterized protein n=1 Tax=Ignelater luminosus TaxID=2038154 RepID=A0A8K0FYZ8_IGNLU|nr:hypothetical protein ILUMI_26395 [Ignelater luminosus]
MFRWSEVKEGRLVRPQKLCSPGNWTLKDIWFPLNENLPELVADDLGTVQKYFWCLLGKLTPGKKTRKLSHSRWLTAAYQTLRLYVSTKETSNNLKTLSKYVMKVYAPIWFHVKLKPSYKDGPLIQRHDFYAHPENIPVSMMTDRSSRNIREMCYHRLLNIRKQEKEDAKRYFKVPNINFNATDYVELIVWYSNNILPSEISTFPPPPIVFSLSISPETPALANNLNPHLWGLLRMYCPRLPGVVPL